MVSKYLKVVFFSIIVLLLAIPSLAQNTKGDKPAGSNRETRFKTTKKNNQKRKPGKRIRQKGDKASNRASMPRTETRTGERPGRPIRPMFSKSRPRGDKQKAWRGDITGRKIRARASSSSSRNVYPQGRYMNYSSRGSQQNARVKASGQNARRPQSAGGQDRPNNLKGRLIPRSASGKVKNVYLQKGLYVNNKSQKPISFQTSANKSALGNLKRYPGADKPPVKNRKVVPRSASSAYIARRSTNTWAHFKRPQNKKEHATTKDLAGKKLRTRNFETQRPVLTNPTLNYQKRIAVGERPYKDPAAGGYLSRTRPTERAWRGDVAGYGIRGGKKPRGRDKGFPGLLKGGGFRSASQSGEKRPGGDPLPVRTPGIGSHRIGYQGNIKASKRRILGNQGEGYTGNIKAGRRGFNNQGEEYTGNIKANRKRGYGNQGEGYTGNINTNRKRGFSNQGEEYSGNINTNRKRGFSNQGEEYSGNIKEDSRRGFSNQGEEYTGNIKSRRPQRGGGSVSGKLWNNRNSPIEGRADGAGNRIASYQGNIRAGKRIFNDQGEEFTGTIKARKPLKGGGSISGKLWNNNEKSLVGRDYSGQAAKVARFTGNIKAKRPDKGGGSISGKLWNNDEKPLIGKDFFSQAVKVARYKGNIKVSNRNKNPNSADEALKGIKPTPSSVKAAEFSRGIRRNWDYIKNPSSDDESQRVREPGKAFARSTDYQGNIKMRKFELFSKRGLHPDAKFVKLNKNNVDEEKDMLTNFKLWWARLFKKSDTQPDHLKEKERKPRYDKGESGMWYE
ncbi:MAG: hypothetical protein ABIR06_00230 [Cyclobacteriaceae bacterium]